MEARIRISYESSRKRKATNMAIANAEKFEELLRSSEELQARLRAATEAYASDKADERAVFEAVIAPLAAELGLPFTLEEASEHAASIRSLDDAELDSIAGGDFSYCFIIGGNDDPDAWACAHGDFGVGACSFIGIGVIYNG